MMFLFFSILILLELGSNVFADAIDVVYLKNGSIIKGIVIEIIPNETIKIETADGSIFVYPFDEVERMEKVEVVGKKPRTKVKLKSRTLATILSLPSFFGISGFGQLYNGQYLKAGLFFIGGVTTIVSLTNAPTGQDDAAAIIHFSQMGYCMYDANVSAKKINQQRMDAVSTSLRYIPNQGLMASYNIRF